MSTGNHVKASTVYIGVLFVVDFNALNLCFPMFTHNNKYGVFKSLLWYSFQK